MIKEHDDELSELSDRNSELLECLKQKEGDYLNSNNELLKLNALLEQKIEMIEEDLKDCKEQKEAKEKDNKELVKECMKLRKDSNKLQSDYEKDK